MWQTDSDITVGANDPVLAYYTHPEVFKIDDVFYLIMSDTSGGIYGWLWDENNWVTDSAITVGLSTGDTGQKITVFDIGVITYAIIGSDNVDYYVGRKWDGFQWITDTDIILGLPGPDDNTYARTPTVFTLDSQLYFIGGNAPNIFHGFKWNGSQWDIESTIISGISSYPSGCLFMFFADGVNYKLIAGRSLYASASPAWTGFDWNGSGWTLNNDIVTGLLSSPDGDLALGGDIFVMDTSTYLLSGSYANGGINSYGYILTPSTIIISCPFGWTFLAQDTSSRTLSDWETFSTPSANQSHYETTGQKYETHRTDFEFDQTKIINQKEGVGLYFNTPTDITLTIASGTITLQTGWNLVGNFGSSDRTLSALKTSIGVEAISASYFNKSTQTFQTDDATIVPAMEAFFVNMSGNVEWSE